VPVTFSYTPKPGSYLSELIDMPSAAARIIAWFMIKSYLKKGMGTGTVPWPTDKKTSEK